MDYFTTQLTGSPCAPYNCAAASGAMGLAAATANAITLTADQFRKNAAVSCVPGAHSTSGGLYISDVIRVFRNHKQEIDYGQNSGDPGYTRWPPATLAARCQQGEGAVTLGDYDQLSAKYQASATFKGDHSVWVHDFRHDSYCWHDPLRKVPIRIPSSEVVRYWQKPNSPVRGYAGFVRVKGAPEVAGLKVTGMQAYSGNVVVNGSGHSAVQIADREYIPVPDGQRRVAFATGKLDPPLDSHSGDRSSVYVIGSEAAILLAMDVRAEPASGDNKVAVTVNGVVKWQETL